MLKDYNSKGFTPLAQLGILIGLLGSGLLLGSVISAGIWSFSTHRPIITMNADMADPKYYAVLMWIQGISTIFIMLIPAFALAMICYKKPFYFLGTNAIVSRRQIYLVLAILFLSFLLNGSLAELNEWIPISDGWEKKFRAMEENRKDMEAVFVDIDSFGKYLASMLVVGAIAAVVEEFFFRGTLQNVLVRWFKNPVVGILVTAVIFSAIHLSYYGFLVRFALGLILGFIYFYSGSIWLSVIFHFLFNGLQVTALYILNLNGNMSPDYLDGNVPIWVIIPTGLIVVYLFKLFRDESAEIPQKFTYIEPDSDDISDWIAHNND